MDIKICNSMDYILGGKLDHDILSHKRGFTGSIADIRLYSRTLSKTGIEAIKYDFEYTLHENGIKVIDL